MRIVEAPVGAASTCPQWSRVMVMVRVRVRSTIYVHTLWYSHIMLDGTRIVFVQWVRLIGFGTVYGQEGAIDRWTRLHLSNIVTVALSYLTYLVTDLWTLVKSILKYEVESHDFSRLGHSGSRYAYPPTLLRNWQFGLKYTSCINEYSLRYSDKYSSR